MRLTINAVEVEARRRREAHAIFHALWTKAVGQPGYIKKEWQLLEALIFGRRGAVGC